jgi:hypothetical protein
MKTKLHRVSDMVRDVEKALLQVPAMGMDVTRRSVRRLPKP